MYKFNVLVANLIANAARVTLTHPFRAERVGSIALDSDFSIRIFNTVGFRLSVSASSILYIYICIDRYSVYVQRTRF